MTPYVTQPADLGVPPRVPCDGGWVTQTPLLDAQTGLAHLTYRTALAVATEHGARLPTREIVLRLHALATEAGTELAPVILPGASPSLVESGARPGDPAMSGWLWCATHDALVMPRMRSFVKSHPNSFVANVGKHWISPCPAGQAAICGWWLDGHFIQEGLGPVHNDLHSDYATTTVLWWPA